MIRQEIGQHYSGFWTFALVLLQPCMPQEFDERSNGSPTKGTGPLGHVINDIIQLGILRLGSDSS
jgi:hypothetical protein